MTKHLYIVVKHRMAEEQTFKNVWAPKGVLTSITTTPAVVAEAANALAQGSRVFIYETKCPKATGSHISQEVKVAEVNPEANQVVFTDHKLIFRKPPFRVTAGTFFKWFELEPTVSVM